MTSLTATVTRPHEATGSMPAPGPGRFLIVNDDAALRLRLAELLGPKCAGATIDTCTREGAENTTALTTTNAAASPSPKSFRLLMMGGAA